MTFRTPDLNGKFPERLRMVKVSYVCNLVPERVKNFGVSVVQVCLPADHNAVVARSVVSTKRFSFRDHQIGPIKLVVEKVHVERREFTL